MSRSSQAIYYGHIDHVENPSIRHFFRGVSGHLLKETACLGFKSTGIVLKPRLDLHFKDDPFGKVKPDVLFAGSLAAAEMMINPVDTVRTMWQAGEKISDIPKKRFLSHLYKGACGNGVRQFGTWLSFPLSERIWSQVLEENTNINPHEIPGIVLKSFPQSLQITGPVWIFERLKNELQYRTDLPQNNRYMQAFTYIRSTQGYQGFFKGLIPKVWSNFFLIIGADYILEQAKRSSSTTRDDSSDSS